MVDNNYLDANNRRNPGVGYLDKNQSPQVTLRTVLSSSSRTVNAITIIHRVATTSKLRKNEVQILLSHHYEWVPTLKPTKLSNPPVGRFGRPQLRYQIALVSRFLRTIRRSHLKPSLCLCSNVRLAIVEFR